MLTSLQGNGAGGFTSCSDVSADTKHTNSVALGDVDGDTDLDAVFANSGQPNRVCLGNGAGGFTSCSNVSSDTFTSVRVALTPPDPEIEVPVDLKPQSCPNPLNVKRKGVLPVAILGTDDFEVTQVDPASVRLEGVAPLRSNIEDVATPFDDSVPNEDCSDCTGQGPDGFEDLTLKFDAQQVIAAIGAVTDKECLLLELTGNLKAEFGGTPIVGEDVILILKKGN